jgi:prephenate dehydrogenase
VEKALDADTVILAMPVLEIVKFIDEFGGRFKPGSLVLDTGSAKQAVVQAMRRRIPESVHAIGGHPMAGTERAGAAGADPAALRGATFVLTPVRRDRVALARARTLVRATGARPVEMDPLVHDRVMARTSHLAHVAAFGLVAAFAGPTGEDEGADDPISPGFRAATRLAASDPVMVSSFLRANADEVGSAIDRLRDFLHEVRAALGADPGRLEALLAQAGLA